MADTTPNTRFRFWLWLIRLIGVIVPRRLRADWQQEWEAELQHRERLLAEWDRLDSRSKLDLLWRSTSAFWDALWMQSHRWEDAMIQDLRYGVRMLMKNPGFSCAVVLTLALGIGVNTAIFTLFNIALRPLPVKDPDEIVEINWRRGMPTLPDYLHLRDHTETLSGLTGSESRSFVLGSQTAQEESREIAAEAVSDNFFSVLGTTPALGRTFTPAETREAVAVISYGLWQRHFGGDKQILGRTLQLGETHYAIVGVMPRDFVGFVINR